ncbi:antibiotic biosynthesis regulator FhaA [Terrabacter aeriphilus]|uniref:Antibiotic biosynthesis regulator FhaA n=1 Tax=Terrabacter aeriphilus TaxID=515662 RepID=A0ABP9J196_9MICO
MGIINRVEHGLAKAVHQAFAKAFKSEVQPVEIASAIRRAMDDRAALLGHGRAMVPNLYTIELSQTDYERLEDYEDDLSDDLVAAAQEHADSQGYQPGAAFEVQLVEGEGLETGVFRVRPATAKRAGTDAEQGRPAPAPQHRAQTPAGTVVDEQPVTRPAPRSNPSARPWLDINGDRYPLLGSLTTLGRDESADIVIDDAGVSRRHSEIRVTTDGPHLVTSIRDLNSTNGTFVNSERVSSQRLQDGDRLTIGRTTATFRAGRR